MISNSVHHYITNVYHISWPIVPQWEGLCAPKQNTVRPLNNTNGIAKGQHRKWCETSHSGSMHTVPDRYVHLGLGSKLKVDHCTYSGFFWWGVGSLNDWPVTMECFRTFGQGSDVKKGAPLTANQNTSSLDFKTTFLVSLSNPVPPKMPWHNMRSMFMSVVQRVPLQFCKNFL